MCSRIFDFYTYKLQFFSLSFDYNVYEPKSFEIPNTDKISQVPEPPPKPPKTPEPELTFNDVNPESALKIFTEKSGVNSRPRSRKTGTSNFTFIEQNIE